MSPQQLYNLIQAAFDAPVGMNIDLVHDVIFVYGPRGRTYRANIYSNDDGILRFRHLTHRGLKPEVYVTVAY